MIRIITKRGDNGVQEEWTDYPDREVGEVPASLALRFDAELVALKLADLDLGVKRWTEAAFRARRFSARATTKIAELLGEESEVPAEERGEESEVPAEERGEAMVEWLAEQPDYLLVQQLGIWSAVNLGGGRMTLLDVLNLADRDVENIDDDPPYLDDDEPEGDEGKA